MNGFIDPARIDRLLARWIDDAADRAFIVRCVVDEGPAHHRGANYILLSLLEELLPPAETASARGPAAAEGPTAAVPLRLPPHLAHEVEDDHFPLRMPTRPLERLAPRDSPHFAAMVDCLTDGPPQHALANAVMMRILDGLLGARGPGGPGAAPSV